MYRLILIMLSFSTFGEDINLQYLSIRPFNWIELQEFQKDHLKTAEELDLSENCPTNLTDMKSFEKSTTAFKVILFYHYYWSEFKTPNGLKCLIKHQGFKFDIKQKQNPFFYVILKTQQAQVLLSATQSFGFREQGINSLMWHIGQHNKAIRNIPFKKYGGHQGMTNFRMKNKPDFPHDPDYLIKAEQTGVSKHLIFFESMYTQEKLNKLIEKAKMESENNPNDLRYPFQSKNDLRQTLEADLKLLNENNLSERVEFLMNLVQPAPKIVWD